MAGKRIDYLPFLPEVIAAACQIAGVTQSAFSTDPDVMAETLVRARDTLGCDGIYVSRDNLVLHQALGGEVVFPIDDEPFSPRCLLDSVEDFTRFSIPSPNKTPGMRTMLEAARLVRGRVGDDYYVQACIDSGPFEMAAILRGVQSFLADILSIEEKRMRAFLSFCTDVVVEYGRAMIDTGAHGIQFGDSVASLVSPELYKKYVLPYQEKAVDALCKRDCDIWIHICGNTRHIIPFLRTLAIQGFEVDSAVSLREARKLIGERIALKGNLDTTFLLTQGVSDVYKETQRMIGIGGFRSGLVVSPGCGVPRMTPLENLMAMGKACRDYRVL